MDQVTINILIAEEIPSHNKGEGALFFGIAESLRPLGNVKLHIISTNPAIDKKYYADTAVIIDARGVIPEHFITGRGSFAIKLSNYAFLLIKFFCFAAGWTLFRQKILSLYKHNFWSSILSANLIIAGHDSAWTPLYHGPLLLLLKWIKIPSVIYGATILPSRPESKGIFKKITEIITCNSLKNASLVTLREKLSLKALHAAGYNGPEPKVYPDLALLMQQASEKNIQVILEKEQIPLDRPLVGMAFSRRVLRRAFHHLPHEEERISAAAIELAKVADILIQDHRARVIFIPHSIGPSGNLDDRIIADQIIAHMQNKEFVINMRGDYDPREIKGICGLLAISLGTRLHFTIDSTSMGVPALLLAYKEDVRCHGIMGELFPHRQVLFSVEELSAPSLAISLHELWFNRQELRHQIMQTIIDAKKRCLLHGQKIATLLEEQN